MRTIVARPERLLAEIGKAEPRRAHRRQRHRNLPPERSRPRPAAPATPPVMRSHSRSIAASHLGPGAEMIDLLARELQPPIVGRRRRSATISHVLLQLGDERQEQLPVEPILVEIVRRDVEVATSVTPPANSLSNSRPSSIALVMSLHLELVEAQQPQPRSTSASTTAATGSACPLPLLALAERGDRRVHLVHELMEMHPPLLARSAPRRRTGPSAWSCRARPRPTR